jgi:L-lysine 6-transaminase
MMTASLMPITPSEVHEVLRRHILADGLDLVFDYERSHGNWLHDARSGREFLDFLSFFGSNPVGFNHPKLRTPEFLQALHRVAALKPSLSDIYSVEYATFVAAFAQLAKPADMRYLFFVEGGALAVENALKAAFDWKVRRNTARGVPGQKGGQIIHFRGAFHGRSGYTLSLTNTDPAKTDYFPKFDWPRIATPQLRFPLTAAAERDVEAAEQEALDQVRRAFADNPDDIAAIIIEPIQAEGGDNHFRGTFLGALQAIARENESLFIVDEVQTGMGLTGKMWCYQHFGLEPDLLAFGKKAQVCGVYAGPRVDEVPDNVFKVPSRINSTWGGNLTDMVRSRRFIEIIENERLAESVTRMGDELVRSLRELARQHGVIFNVRGRGSLVAFTLESKDARQAMLKQLFERKLLALPSGQTSIRFRLPLNISSEEVSAVLERVADCLPSRV